MWLSFIFSSIDNDIDRPLKNKPLKKEKISLLYHFANANKAIEVSNPTIINVSNIDALGVAINKSQIEVFVFTGICTEKYLIFEIQC